MLVAFRVEYKKIYILNLASIKKTFCYLSFGRQRTYIYCDEKCYVNRYIELKALIVKNKGYRKLYFLKGNDPYDAR